MIEKTGQMLRDLMTRGKLSNSWSYNPPSQSDSGPQLINCRWLGVGLFLPQVEGLACQLLQAEQHQPKALTESSTNDREQRSALPIPALVLRCPCAARRPSTGTRKGDPTASSTWPRKHASDFLLPPRDTKWLGSTIKGNLLTIET